MINAYFNCVNDNGGVNGHPFKLFVELDQTQPAQVAAAAKKLIQSDHVVAIDGVFDLLECTIDQGYWKQLGIYEMDAGIAPECWSTPEQRRGQHGTALQLRRGRAVRARTRRRPRRSCSSSPTSRAPATSPPVRRRSRRPRACRSQQLTENVPINDANSVALNLVNSAGPDGCGGAQLHPARGAGDPAGRPEARPRGPREGHGAARLRATRTSWPRRWDRSGTTSCSSTPSWPRPTTTTARRCGIYKGILAKYGQNVAGGIGSFSEMGSCWRSSWSRRCRTVKGDYTMKSVNDAILGDQGLQDRAAVPAVDVRQGGAAHPEQLRLHDDARKWEDGDGPGLHPHLRRRPADRAVPLCGEGGRDLVIEGRN